MVADGQPGRSPTQKASEIDDLLQALDLPDATIVRAGWSDRLRDLWLVLGNDLELTFRECIQVGFNRPLSFDHPLAIGGWWTDEPSPLLRSLAPEIRPLFHHLVLEVGDGLLRVVFRRLEASPAREIVAHAGPDIAES